MKKKEDKGYRFVTSKKEKEEDKQPMDVDPFSKKIYFYIISILSSSFLSF